MVCSVYNQPYYKGWYSLGVVYRDLPQHHHNLMDEVPGKLSAEVRYVTFLSRCLNCSVTLDTVLSFAFTAKGKAILLQAWTGPEGSRSLRLPDFMTIGT